MLDSNQRLLRCHRSALPTELIAHDAPPCERRSGEDGNRTRDPLLAKQMLFLAELHPHDPADWERYRAINRPEEEL